MTVHAEILRVLGERWGELVPRITENPTIRLCHLEGTRQYEWRYVSGGREHYCRQDDAHAHIELAAWKAVRGWCRQQDAGLIVSDIGHTPVGITVAWMSKDVGDSRPMQFYRPLGNGPTDADALLAALNTIGGMA